jgi:hypothetical protein
MPKYVDVTVREDVVLSMLVPVVDILDDDDFPLVLNPDNLVVLSEWLEEFPDLVVDQCGDSNVDYVEEREIIEVSWAGRS